MDLKQNVHQTPQHPPTPSSTPDLALAGPEPGLLRGLRLARTCRQAQKGRFSVTEAPGESAAGAQSAQRSCPLSCTASRRPRPQHPAAGRPLLSCAPSEGDTSLRLQTERRGERTSSARPSPAAAAWSRRHGAAAECGWHGFRSSASPVRETGPASAPG